MGKDAFTAIADPTRREILDLLLAHTILTADDGSNGRTRARDVDGSGDRRQNWRARRDSNARPLASEANTLSS